MLYIHAWLIRANVSESEVGTLARISHAYYAWLIRANVSDSEHNQSESKHTLRHSYDPQYTLAG